MVTDNGTKFSDALRAFRESNAQKQFGPEGKPRHAAIGATCRPPLDAATVKRYWLDGVPELLFPPIKHILLDKTWTPTVDYDAVLDKRLNTSTISSVKDSGASSAEVRNPPNESADASRYEKSQVAPTSLIKAPQSSFDNAAARVLEERGAALLAELSTIKAGRNASIGLFIWEDKVLKEMVSATEEALKQMMLDIKHNLDKPFSLDRIVKLLSKLARIHQLNTMASAKFMEMSRLLIGLPQAITEHRTPGTSAEEAAAREHRLASLLGAGARPAPIDVTPVTPYEGEESLEGQGHGKVITSNRGELGQRVAKPLPNPSDV